MSTRKTVRNKMRRQAELMQISPSKWVHNEFHRYQVKALGAAVRTINQAKGTHKRRTWKMRIAAVMP